MKKNQLKAGIVLSYITTAIEILTYLVYTPLLTELLGQSEYGVYTVVASVVSYLSLFSCGFGSAYLRFYSIYKVKDEQKEIDGLNAMFLSVFSIMALCAAVTGIFLAVNVDVVLGSKITAAEVETARTLMIILAVNIALSFPIGIFDAIITANECYVFQKLVNLLRILFNPILVIPLLLAGYKSVAVVMVTTLLTVAALIVNIIYCFGKLHAKFDFKYMKFGLLKSISGFSFFVFINMIVNQINWNVDKFILVRYVGTGAVAVYGVASQVNSMYQQLSTQFSAVFAPRVNIMVAEKKEDIHKRMTDLFIKVGRMQCIILLLVLLGFIVFGRYFLKLWVGNEYSSAYEVILLLIVPVTVPLVQNLGIEIQRATNQHKFRSVVYLCIAVANVIVSIPLAKLYGEVGCAAGTAGSLLIGNGFVMNWYYHKKMGIDVIKFWKSIGRLCLAAVPSIILGIWIMQCVEFDSIFKYLLLIVLFSIVYLFSMWMWGMNKEEKQMILGILEKIRGKRKVCE